MQYGNTAVRVFGLVCRFAFHESKAFMPILVVATTPRTQITGQCLLQPTPATPSTGGDDCVRPNACTVTSPLSS